MSKRRLADLADRPDVFVDHAGRVYCWTCLEAAGIDAEALTVTGQRLGTEPCHACGAIGTVIVETE